MTPTDEKLMFNSIVDYDHILNLEDKGEAEIKAEEVKIENAIQALNPMKNDYFSSKESSNNGGVEYNQLALKQHKINRASQLNSVKNKPFGKNKNQAQVFNNINEIKGLGSKSKSPKSPREEKRSMSPDLNRFMKFTPNDNITSDRTYELPSPTLTLRGNKQPPATHNLKKRSRTKV